MGSFKWAKQLDADWKFESEEEARQEVAALSGKTRQEAWAMARCVSFPSA